MAPTDFTNIYYDHLLALNQYQNARKPKIWPILLSQNSAKIMKNKPTVIMI